MDETLYGPVKAVLAMPQVSVGMSAIAQTRFEIECNVWESPGKGGPAMAPHPTDQAWRCIAEQASKEIDPANLMTLVAHLFGALNRERGSKTEFQPQPENHTGAFHYFSEQHAPHPEV